MQVKKQKLESYMEQLTGSKLRKKYNKALYCHPVYLTDAEHIIQNSGLDELPAGIKIAGRHTNDLSYADGTTLMAESKEELKSLLMIVRE